MPLTVTADAAEAVDERDEDDNVLVAPLPALARAGAGRNKLAVHGRASASPPARPPHELRARYHEAFHAWLAHRDERELGTAYALGPRGRERPAERARPRRDAPRGGAARRWPQEPDAARRDELLEAAGVFFGEALSTFEIAHRGYREVQEVARLEHEHVMQLRALADASVRDQRDDDHRGRAAAHRRGGARGARRRATRRSPSTAGRPVRARAQRRVADRRRRRRRRPARRSA